MGLTLHASNDLDRLATGLARALAAEAADTEPQAALRSQVVLVPSQGIRDWLRRRIAGALGICAGVDLPFPGRFLAEDLPATLGLERDAAPAWDPARARWAVLGALAGMRELTACCDDVADAIATGAEPPGTRAYGLAAACVECFDRYALYRPAETLEPWSAGAAGAWDERAPWQPELWRAVCAQPGIGDPCRRFERVRRALEGGAGALPATIHAFGFNTLAPRYRELLAALACSREVVLWALQPAWGDWDDQRPYVQLVREEEEYDPEWYNRLLGDWGRVGREFLRVLDDVGCAYHADIEDFRDPGAAGCVLGRLQHDLLLARGAHAEPALDAADGSVQIHACHSARRELEVVKQVLLRRFAADRSLGPEDVVVMCPRSEEYAPLATAVFAADGDGPALSLSIADRSAAAANPVAEVLLRLVRLLPGRWPASEVLELLASAPVAAARGLGGEQLARIQDLLDRGDIRWGVDAAHRAACGAPAYAAGSWRHGLARLRLAWVFGADADAARVFGARERAWDAVVPVAGIEPEDLDALRALEEAVEPLLLAAARCRAPRPAAEWAAALDDLLRHMLGRPAIEEPELAAVLEGLAGFAAEVADAGHHVPLEPGTVAAHLAERFGAPDGGGFARGAITFCGLQPLRSIPFRVICLVGMEDGAFPRQQREQDFDLVALDHHRPGDRDLREEDRYLGLELLLSCRDCLCITWRGFDAHTNEELPPSAYVAALLEQLRVLCPDFAPVAHRLHASHDRLAFPDAAWGSPLLRAEAEALATAGGDRAMASVTRLPPPEPPLVIDVAALVAHWKRPARAHLARLGVRARAPVEQARDHERLDPAAGLDRFRIGERFLAVDPADEPDLAVRLAAAGALPIGAPGRAAWQAAQRRFAPLRDRVRPLLAAAAPLSITLEDHSQVHVRGEIPLVHPQYGVLLVHPGRRSAARELELWVYCCLAAAAGGPGGGLLLSCDGDPERPWALGPVTDGAAQLRVLLDGYYDNCRAPLPFTPETGRRYVEQLARSGADAALRAARQSWVSDSGPGAERDQPANALVWAAPQCPVDHPSFVHWARAVWEPLFVAAEAGA
ncbi:MAG: exodeoxyribonuclease V subunit gamma [Planctomycetota bacterium]